MAEHARWAGGAAGLGFALALAAALLFSADTPAELARDAAGYDALGWRLASGLGYTNAAGYPEVLRTPGYPVFLASLYGLFGHHLLPVWIAHAALHAGTTALVHRLARALRPGDRAWARLAALAFAAYPFALHGGSRVLNEALATGLLTGVTVLLVEARDRPARFALAGAGIGALALVRPVFALFPFAAAGLWLLRGDGPLRRRLGRAGILVAVSLACTLPWAARTGLIVGRPVLLGAGGIGNNLHIAAWEYRDLSGGLPRTTDFEQRPGFRAADARVLREAEAPRFSPAWVVEIDQARLALAKQQIAAHPGLYLRSTLIRVPKLWVSQFLPGLPLWMGDLAALAGLGLLGLGIAGALCLRPWRGGRALLLAGPLYLGLIHAPLHAEARYTLPARPVLVLLATLALLELVRARARR